MRIQLLLVVALFVVAFNGTPGCNRLKKSKAEAAVAVDSTDKDKIVYPDANGEITLDLTDGRITGKIHKASGKFVSLKFDSGSYDSLYAKITVAGDMANVRFNQIFMPDGSSDGPFGRDISYNLPQQGEYELSIGESLMQGDPWEGDFTFDMQLYKN